MWPLPKDGRVTIHTIPLPLPSSSRRQLWLVVPGKRYDFFSTMPCVCSLNVLQVLRVNNGLSVPVEFAGALSIGPRVHSQFPIY